MVYRATSLTCELGTFPATDDLVFYTPNSKLVLLVIVIRSLVPLLAFIVVCISFVISVVLIMCRRRRTTNRRHVRNMHQHAAITVIIVILTYIICNIPFLVMNGNVVDVVQMNVMLDSADEEMTVVEYRALLLKKVLERVPEGFLVNIMVVVRVMSASINSAVNPAVYYFRMSRYRNFVTDVTARIMDFLGFPPNEEDAAANNNDNDLVINNLVVLPIEINREPDDAVANNNDEVFANNIVNDPLILNAENAMLPMTEIVIVHHQANRSLLSITHPEADHSNSRPQSPVRPDPEAKHSNSRSQSPVRRRLPLYIYSTPPSRSPPLPLRLSSRKTSM